MNDVHQLSAHVGADEPMRVAVQSLGGTYGYIATVQAAGPAANGYGNTVADAIVSLGLALGARA